VIAESKVSDLNLEVARLKKLVEDNQPKKIGTLDRGYVELYDWMGDDLRIVNMARQSFGQESAEMGEAENGLINFLARERHGTPFESPVFHFNVKCPIFVAREWFRHRISSYNEYSGRYSKMMNEFYVPRGTEIRTQVGKPGAYKFEQMEPDDVTEVREVLKLSGEGRWQEYEALLERGVAKEVARMVLPVNIYTKFSWVVNLRSLLNFISLRSDENAMWEIRQYSKNIEELIKPVVPVAFGCFEEHGRTAP
jgi:thymidylate synthase (FAD)